MTDFALVRGGEIVRVQTFPDGEEPPALAVNKGAWLPIVEETAGFDPATQVQEPVTATIEAERVVMAAPVRDKTGDEIEAMRAEKVAAIKAQASQRILALYPAWRQANMTARAIELISLRMDGDLSEGETAEQDGLRAAFAAIKAIRQISNELEAEVPADAAGIHAFDPAEGWG